MNVLFRFLRCFGHQHWIPSGRDRVIRLLASPDTIRPTPFRIPFFGHVYEGDLSNFIDWSVYFYGAFSRYELDLLADLCALFPPERRPYMLDIGANGGHHTLFMAGRCERVDAFEPFPPAIALMESRLRANNIGNCRVHPFGLGDRTGTGTFMPPAGSNPGVGYFDMQSIRTDEGHPSIDRLPLVRGDDYLDAHEVPATDIVKMDVEGAEAAALAGLAGRLRRDRPAVLMELSDRSRAAFGDADGFRAALYPDAVILAVTPVSVSGTYRLSAFDFQQASEILVLPAEYLRERTDRLPRRLAAALGSS
jgi:FkbM family methyltransferase